MIIIVFIPVLDAQEGFWLEKCIYTIAILHMYFQDLQSLVKYWKPKVKGSIIFIRF